MKSIPDLARESMLKELTGGELAKVSGAGQPPCETYTCFYIFEEYQCGYVLDAEEFC